MFESTMKYSDSTVLSGGW